MGERLAAKPGARVRRSVRATVARLAAWVALGATALYAGIAVPLVHSGVHSRVDGLLATLAAQLLEHTLHFDAPAGHLEPHPVWVWGLGADAMRPSSWVGDLEGGQRRASGSLVGLRLETPEVRAKLAGGEAGAPEFFDLPAPTGETMWVARVASGPERARAVVAVVGLPHEDIDGMVLQAVLWALLPALASVLGLAALAFFFARRLGSDLAALRHECAGLDFARTDLANVRPPRFPVSPSAPEEVFVLAQTLRRSVERWQSSTHNQARFLTEAAHELRTPLTALCGELEVALRRKREASDYERVISEALVDARRLGELAEELLELSRERSRELAVAQAPVYGTLLAVVDRFRSLALSKGVALELVDGDPTVSAAYDPGALGRVLDNLVNNALVHGARERVLLAVTHRPDGGANIWVADDGPGVPPAVRAALFVPFVRGEARSGSHGLGLYLARELVERMGGALSHCDDRTTIPPFVAQLGGAVWLVGLQ